MDVKNSKNRGTKSIVIDREKYDSLLSMLNSSEEDANVAFECINTLDIKNNIIPILLLRKHSNTKIESWKKKCSKHIKYHKSIDINDEYKNLSYTEVYATLKKVDVTEEHKNIFLQELSNFFKRHAIKFDFIEDLDIKVQLK